MLFDIPRLQEQLRLMQEGQDLTADDLREVINKNVIRMIQFIGFDEEALEKYIDFEKLAVGLNKLRSGHTSDELKEAFNIERIGELLGKDLRIALDKNVPEEVQLEALNGVVEHITDKTLLTRCREGLPFAAVPVMLWLAGHTFCHPCMEFFEPQNWYTAGPLLIGVGYVTCKAAEFFTKEVPVKAALINSVAVKAHRVCSQFLTNEFPKDNAALMELIPEDYRDFVRALSKEHIGTLPGTKCLLTLFTKPRSFVAKYGNFIISICTHDKINTEYRLETIEKLLKEAKPLEELAHVEKFQEFIDYSEEALNKLPHESIITIAQYCPHLLEGQTDFLAEATTNTFGEDQTPVIKLYYIALKQAAPQQKIDIID